MDWAFLFFLKRPPKQVFTEKEKGEKNCGCFGGKKHAPLFPKVVFHSKARKGGFCVHYRKRFLASLSVFLALSGLHLRLSSSSCSSCEDLLLAISVQVRVP
jgi:hypothetical protein